MNNRHRQIIKARQAHFLAKSREAEFLELARARIDQDALSEAARWCREVFGAQAEEIYEAMVALVMQIEGR